MTSNPAIFFNDPNFIDIQSIRVLVTTNYEVAKKFRDNVFVKKADEIVKELNELELNSIFLNPYNTLSQQRFERLEYSFGYTDSGDAVNEGENNFQVTLTMKDMDGSLETNFLENMIDFALAKKTLEGIRSSVFSSFTGNINSLLTGKENDIVKYNFINRNFYFIFINRKNIFLSPIVSEFYGVEVSQDSTSKTLPSIRFLKLKFICTGHVNVLSKLASLKYYKPESLANNPYKNVKQTTFSLKRSADLNELEGNPEKLDFFIKSILKDLFEEITGREVLLILPDFGKIYTNFKKNIIVNQLGASLNNLSNSFLTTYINALRLPLQTLYTFFELLGFNIFDSGGKEELLEQFIQGLPASERQKFKKFQASILEYLNQADQSKNLGPTIITNKGIGKKSSPKQNIKLLLSRLIKDINSLQGDIALSEDEKDMVFTGSDYAKKNFIQSPDYSDGILFLGGGVRGPIQLSIIDQLKKLKDDPNPNSEEIIKELSDILINIQLVRLKTIANANNKTFDFTKGIGLIKDKKSTEQGGQPLDASLNPNEITINFSINSDDTPQSGSAKLPNFVDYNEFANNFCNRLKVVAENSDFNSFNISYTEENTLLRLKLLQDNVKFNGTSCLRSVDSPCIVIFDQWLFENYYCPLQGEIRESPGVYPISKEDLNNYGPQSKYVASLLNLKGINKFIRNGFLNPFDGDFSFSDKDSFNDFANNDTETTRGEVTNAFSPDVAVLALQTITPESSSILLGKNLNPFSLFVYNSLAPDPDKGGYNILNFNLVGDTLNTFATYNSYLTFVEDSLTQEYLLPAKVDAVRTALGSKTTQQLQNAIKQYYSKTLTMTELREEFTKTIEQRYDIRPFSKGLQGDISVLDREALEDLIKYFGSKSDERLLDTYKKYNNLEEEIGEKGVIENVETELYNIRQRAIDRVFDILFSFSFRSNKNGYKAVTVEYLSDPVNRAAELFNLMMQKIYTLTIKTYPTFQINSVSDLNTPCAVLIYNRHNNLGYSRKPESLIRQLSPISGIYRIQGFKHTIAKDASLIGLTALSEFVLVKNVNVGSVE